MHCSLVKLRGLNWIAFFLAAGLVMAVGLFLRVGWSQQSGAATPRESTIMWINHLDLAFNNGTIPLFSAFGGGFPNGLLIQMLGDTTAETGLEVPPGFLIAGVRVCYGPHPNTDLPEGIINSIRLVQLNDPPNSASVLMNDQTVQPPGPICVDSIPTSVDPRRGAVRLDLGMQLPVDGRGQPHLVIYALGLHLMKLPGR